MTSRPKIIDEQVIPLTMRPKSIPVKDLISNQASEQPISAEVVTGASTNKMKITLNTSALLDS